MSLWSITDSQFTDRHTTMLSISKMAWLVVWSIFWTTRVGHLNYSDLHCQEASRNQHALGHLAADIQTDPSYLVQLNCLSD